MTQLQSGNSIEELKTWQSTFIISKVQGIGKKSLRLRMFEMVNIFIFSTLRPMGEDIGKLSNK